MKELGVDGKAIAAPSVFAGVVIGTSVVVQPAVVWQSEVVTSSVNVVAVVEVEVEAFGVTTTPTAPFA
jgi:hypothetical protein